jgi:hypothetical protein
VEIVGMPEGMMQEEPSNRKQSSQNTNEDQDASPFSQQQKVFKKK